MTSNEKTVVVIEQREGDDGDQNKSSAKSMRKRSSASHRRRRSSSRSRQRRSISGMGHTSGVSSMQSERASIFGWEAKQPFRKYLNTYQLDPTKPFNSVKVTAIIENTLQEFFLAHVYHRQRSPALALIIAGEIRYRVKYQRYNRYRIIAIVTIGQRKFQSYNNAVAFLWDHDRDGYTNCTMQVPTAFIQVTLFAIYLD